MRSLPILVITAFVALSVPPGPAQPEAELLARIHNAAKFYRDRDGFMGVAAVQRNHHLVAELSYGYADIATKTPFGPDTRFPIGSLSKQFTAAAILLLQQDGKLKTSDHVRRYYRNAPASWSTVTLKNLLTHTSGIPDFDFGRIYRDSPHRPDELLKEVLNKPLAFQPGAKFEYSNVNYMLLGLVVQRVSGQPFCQFVRDRIFHPLQLKQTGCASNTRDVRRAHGYHPSAQGPVAFEDKDLGGLTGAGSLYSSADDLIRWTEALFGGKVLSKASLAEMTTPFLNGYGYGLSIEGQGAQLQFSHDGAVEGFFTCLDYVPATRTTVVVLSNLLAEGNQTSPGTLALDSELVRLGMDEDLVLPSEGREATVAEESLRGYAGRSRSDDPNHSTGIALTFREGRLFIQNEGGAALPLYAESTTMFYLKSQETEIFFDTDVPGRFQFVDWTSAGGATFNRIPESKSDDLPAK